MLNFGIIGMGYIGRIHYEASQMLPELKVLAVASSRTDYIRLRYPKLEVRSSYQELLEDSRLDAIIICVPTYLDERLVIETVARGRHVLCEKPLALNASSGARILDAVREAGVAFMVSQVLRFWPQYLRIKEVVREGILGRVLSVSAQRIATAPSWSEWFRDPKKGDGCLLDLQVHDLDFIFSILGKPSRLQSVGLKSDNGCWDHVHTVLKYDGAIASIESSYVMPSSWPLTAGIRVVGSSAAVEFAFRSPGDVATRSQSQAPTLLYCSGGKIKELVPDGEDMFVAQL